MRAMMVFFGVLLLAAPCYGLISVGSLDKEQAAEKGIVMKKRANGEAGVKVWIEFKKEGFMANLVYCEMKMADDDGEHLISARLEPHRVVHDQAPEVHSFAFSVAPEKLERCFFFVVAQEGLRTGVGYYLPVKQFFEEDGE